MARKSISQGKKVPLKKEHHNHEKELGKKLKTPEKKP